MKLIRRLRRWFPPLPVITIMGLVAFWARDLSTFEVAPQTGDTEIAEQGNKDQEGATALSIPASLTVPEKAVTERPLFQSDRRPYAIPVVDAEPEPEPEPEPETTIAEPAPPPPIPDFVYLGILNDGVVQKALIAVKGQDQRWLAVNDKIAGWKLRVFDADFVTLSDGDREITVQLSR